MLIYAYTANIEIETIREYNWTIQTQGKIEERIYKRKNE